ncbi:hypothetical protein C3L33_18442, partial [Rhododendron williamsianum]
MTRTNQCFASMGPPPPSHISIPSLSGLAQATRGVRRPPPPPSMSNPTAHPAAAPLLKHKSWSPDVYRDEAWLLRRKGINDRRKRRSKSVTDEDLDELKACIELGFGFDSPEVDPGLSDTLPALGLYYAVNKTYYDSVSKSSSSLFSSTASECESPSSVGSPSTILGLGNFLSLSTLSEEQTFAIKNICPPTIEITNPSLYLGFFLLIEFFRFCFVFRGKCGEGDNPQTVKTRLRQWAQVVACSVRQSSSG